MHRKFEENYMPAKSCMDKRSARIYIVIIVTIIFLVYGCGSVKNNQPPVSTASPEQMDESPFSGAPCETPCWQGLEVGESNENDVRAVLPNLKFIDQDSIVFYEMNMPTLDWQKYAPGVEITANCINSKGKCLEIYISENTLTEINITLNYAIRADEAVAYFGTPSYVATGPISVRTGVGCAVFLIWRDSRVVLTSTLYGKSTKELYDCSIVHQTGKASPGLIITQVSYLSEASMQGRVLEPSASDLFKFSGFASEQ